MRNRLPFSTAAPTPTDLVLPVSTLADPDRVTVLGREAPSSAGGRARRGAVRARRAAVPVPVDRRLLAAVLPERPRPDLARRTQLVPVALGGLPGDRRRTRPLGPAVRAARGALAPLGLLGDRARRRPATRPTPACSRSPRSTGARIRARVRGAREVERARPASSPSPRHGRRARPLPGGPAARGRRRARSSRTRTGWRSSPSARRGRGRATRRSDPSACRRRRSRSPVAGVAYYEPASRRPRPTPRDPRGRNRPVPRVQPAAVGAARGRRRCRSRASRCPMRGRIGGSARRPSNASRSTTPVRPSRSRSSSHGAARRGSGSRAWSSSTRVTAPG